jgi:WD40 repeat protein
VTYLASLQNEGSNSLSTSPQEPNQVDREGTPLLELQQLLSPDYSIRKLSFANNGKRLAICGQGQGVMVNIYETEYFTLSRSLESGGENVYDVKWSPDDSKLLTMTVAKDGDFESSIQIWDVIVSWRASEFIATHRLTD